MLAFMRCYCETTRISTWILQALSHKYLCKFYPGYIFFQKYVFIYVNACVYVMYICINLID